MTTKTPTQPQKFEDREITFTGSYGWPVIRMLAWFWNDRRLKWLLYLVGLVASRAAFIFSIQLTGYWADSLCPQGQHCQPLPPFLAGLTTDGFLLAMAALAVIYFVAASVTQAAMTRNGLRAGSEVLTETMYRVSRAPARFFDHNPVGRIFARFSSDYQSLNMALGPHFTQIAAMATELLLMLAVTLVTNPLFVGVYIVIFAGCYALYLLNRSYMRTLRRQATSQRAPSISHLSATVRGNRSIRSHLREADFMERFRKLIRAYYRDKGMAELAIHLFALQLNAFIGIVILATCLGGIKLLPLGMITIGQLGVLIGFASLIANLIQRIFGLLTSLEHGLSGAERLHQYLHMPQEAFQDLPPASRYRQEAQPGRNPASPPVTKGAVGQPTPPAAPLPAAVALGIHNLTFTYPLTQGQQATPPASAQPVIAQLSLEVAPGEHIGIIGRTGSGKSTLFKLIMADYLADSGSITIAGKSLGPRGHRNRLSLPEWRRHIAYISQETPLFQAPLRDNLGQNIDDQQAIALLQTLGFGEWLDRNNLDTVITENGSNLSLGQRQLIALARAAITPAPLVLVDEATSAIDPQTEARITAVTDTLLGQATRITIAHRPSTLTKCDRLIWLAAGRIHQAGPPQEVLAAFRKALD